MCRARRAGVRRGVVCACCFLDPNDTLIGGILYKGLDFIYSGGYMDRYDGRLKQLTNGELTYDQFVSANFVDYMATALAMDVSISAAGKVTGWVERAGFNKIIAGMAGGAAAGITFEGILQAGLTEIYQLTNGKTGTQEMSLNQILFSGGLGALVGGAGAALFAGIGKLVGRGSDPVQGKIGQNDPNGSPADTIDMTSPNSNGSTNTIGDNTLPYVRPGSNVVVAGKTAFTAPNAGSLVLGDASTWFSQQVARLPEMIDTSLPLSAQFEQAYQLRQMLRSSGANGLVDGTLTGEFLEEFVLASREGIRAKFADQYSGDALYRKMLDEVLAKVDDTIASETSCFIAGTPVWTEAGEVPIESIKPGDMVLSRPEEGGELAYRPVVRTVTHTNKVIVAVTYVDPEKPDRKSLNFATDNHPFWVEGRGWVAAGAMRPGYELQGTDGRKIVVSAISPVYRTETPGVGWYQLDPNYGALGNDVDFNGPTWRLVKSRTSRPNEEFVDGPFLGVNVYNFEVDGFHTYYVGSSGVWVHNANCAFKLTNDGNGALPPKGTKAYATEAEMRSQLTDGQTGYMLVRSVIQTYVEKLGDKDLYKWINFEDGVVGRIQTTKGIRYEYAVLFKNADGGRTNNYIKVEGREVVDGNNVWVDRKRAFQNILTDDGRQSVLDIFWRASQAMKQNPGDKFVYEIESPINVMRALELIADIRSGKLQFTEEVQIGDDLVTQATKDSAAKIKLILEMLNSDRLNVRGYVKGSQEGVAIAGPYDNVTPLTMTDVNAVLAQAKAYWRAMGASPAILDALTVRLDSLALGFAGDTDGTTITLDTLGAGWGWYVGGDGDPVFEPTASASVFHAISGSAADGKLDLLTVLTHEIGHIVGLSDTFDDSSMGSDLAPGVRRLPSAEDVAALAAAAGIRFQFGDATNTAGSTAATPGGTGSGGTFGPPVAPTFSADLSAWQVRGLRAYPRSVKTHTGHAASRCPTDGGPDPAAGSSRGNVHRRRQDAGGNARRLLGGHHRCSHARRHRQ